MSDNYVGVTAKVLCVRPKAVLLEGEGGQGWIPRSCIHAADDSILGAVGVGDEISVRMFEWIAQKSGLI